MDQGKHPCRYADVTDARALDDGVDVWKNAAAGANANCAKCSGTGVYHYDHNHGTICPECCRHNMGFWQLGEIHGGEAGKWCCGAGCGKTWDVKPL